MGRLNRLSERLERVLSLAELMLQELTGSGAAPALLEHTHAFRWDASRGPGRLIPIEDPAGFDLNDLIGVDAPLERLIQNTEQFLNSARANHVLLYGERGTGKSSAVKGLLTRFSARGLRMVQVHKSELTHLPRILAALRGLGRDYHFVVFCDDLSFDTGEAGFRELKAALEGSLEAPPRNVCIIATSNRRHLVPESMADNRSARVDERGELQIGEALDEKLALSDRFGLVLGFYAFDQQTYLSIVQHYLKQFGLAGEWKQVREEALRWALRRANRSGRTARQFVIDLAGRLES